MKKLDKMAISIQVVEVRCIFVKAITTFEMQDSLLFGMGILAPKSVL